MESAMGLLDAALLSSYRLSIVTTPLSTTGWRQFAMQILTVKWGFWPPSFLPWGTGTPIWHSVILDHTKCQMASHSIHWL